jgi:hypothetical protein
LPGARSLRNISYCLIISGATFNAEGAFNTEDICPFLCREIRKPAEKKTTRLGVLRTTSKRKQKKDAKTTEKGKRSRAPSATKKTTARVASVRIPKKQRKEKKETEDDVKPEDITMTETPLKQLFHWPEQMAKVFFTDCCDAQKKPVHVQLWTEFSGAGTPEFALKALASQVLEHLSMQVMSQCDWSPTAQTCCINNSDKDTHLFSDIADIMSEEMKARAERRVAVEVAWFIFICDVWYFSFLFIYILYDFPVPLGH